MSSYGKHLIMRTIPINSLITSILVLLSITSQTIVASDKLSETNKLSGTVIVVNQRSDTVSLIDIANMKVYKTINVVGGPHEAAVSPDGKRVIVTNYYSRNSGSQKTLSLISLAEGKVIKTIDLGRFSRPHDVQWVNDYQVVCTVEANKALLLVNVNTAKVERIFKTNKNGSHMLALSKDHKRLYSSNMVGNGTVTVFDFKTGQKITDIKTGSETEGVGVTPDGRWVWAGNREENTVSIIDTTSLEVVKILPSEGFPYRVEFTPNGKYALVPHAVSGTLMVGDVKAQTVIKHIPLGMTKVSKPSTAGVFPHPDNVHAFVTVRNDNSVLIINLESGETLGRVQVQSSPDGVTYSPLSPTLE